MPEALSDLIIIIRGAGEMATGAAHRLHRSGFYRLLMTETEAPLCVRRLVSFCEAVHEKTWTVEGIEARRIETPDQAADLWKERVIPVIVDPHCKSRSVISPDIVLDGIMAKTNLGTSITDARFVLALGPGFEAGKDAHAVVETNRGHDLARLIIHGAAAEDTGIPGPVMGETVRRVIRAPCDGIFQPELPLASLIEQGTIVGTVDGSPVTVALSGVLRGLIRADVRVTKGLKIGDVDPRGETLYCYTISEKARAIAGTVLEAVMMRFHASQSVLS